MGLHQWYRRHDPVIIPGIGTVHQAARVHCRHPPGAASFLGIVPIHVPLQLQKCQAAHNSRQHQMTTCSPLTRAPRLPSTTQELSVSVSYSTVHRHCF